MYHDSQDQPLWPVRAWFDDESNAIVVATIDTLTDIEDFRVTRTYAQAVSMVSRIGRVFMRNLPAWAKRDKNAALMWAQGFESGLADMIADFALEADTEHDSLDHCQWQDGLSFADTFVAYTFDRSTDPFTRIFTPADAIFLTAQLARALVDWEAFNNEHPLDGF